MKTITITIQVPDGVTIDAATTVAAPPAPTGHAPVCPKHGPDRVADSKFGGWYCKAADDSEAKGYCSWKAK